jgi:hypothetical protein
LYKQARRVARLQRRYREIHQRGAKWDVAVCDRYYDQRHVLGDMVVAATGFNHADRYARCPICGQVSQTGKGWKTEQSFRRHVEEKCSVLDALGWAEPPKDDSLLRRRLERQKIAAVVERPSHLYVIRCMSTSRLKIGIAVDVEARRLGLQGGSPTQLQVIAVVPAGGRYLEQRLHEHCKLWRLHGEWFEAAAWETLRAALPENVVYSEGVTT